MSACRPPTTSPAVAAHPRRLRRRRPVRRPRTPAHRSPAARSARPAPPATSTAPSTGPPRRSPTWRTTPAPVRGNLVRRLGELLREHKDDLGELVSIEAGKIRSEGLGEVQEMIDICDFAVGLSRQLHGLTIASERPGPPADGDVAPDGAVRRHHGVQLPRRRVVVERRAGARRRRPGDVEAVGQDAADRAGVRRPAARGPRPTSARRTGSTRCCRAGPTSAPRWPPTTASPSCRPPARRAWAGPSRRSWRRASAA